MRPLKNKSVWIANALLASSLIFAAVPREKPRAADAARATGAKTSGQTSATAAHAKRKTNANKTTAKTALSGANPHRMSASPSGETLVSTSSSRTSAPAGIRLASAATGPLSGFSSAPVNNSTAQADPISPRERKKTAGLDATFALNSSVYSPGANSYSSSLDFKAAPWTAIGRSYRLDAEVGVAKDLSGYREAKLTNSVVGFSHNPIPVFSWLKYRPKATTTLPTDRDLREATSFRNSLGLSNRFLFDLKGLPDLSSYYQLGFTKNFYQYQTTRDGESNNSYQVSQRLLLNYALGRFYVETGPGLVVRYTYEGNPSTSFEAYEELGYNFARDAGYVAIGVTNEGNFYKENGRDSNFAIIDRDSTNYYLAVGINL